jgi:hypothetical protein
MNIDLYGKDPLGKAFEGVMKYYFKKLYGDAFIPANHEEDCYEGTDFFINGIRIDVTLKPVKRKAKYIDSFVIPGCTIHVQLRYGNHVQDFSEPVLLLYFESFIGNDPYDLVDLIEEECDREFFDKVLSLYQVAVNKHANKRAI